MSNGASSGILTAPSPSAASSSSSSSTSSASANAPVFEPEATAAAVAAPRRELVSSVMSSLTMHAAESSPPVAESDCLRDQQTRMRRHIEQLYRAVKPVDRTGGKLSIFSMVDVFAVFSRIDERVNELAHHERERETQLDAMRDLHASLTAVRNLMRLRRVDVFEAASAFRREREFLAAYDARLLAEYMAQKHPFLPSAEQRAQNQRRRNTLVRCWTKARNALQQNRDALNRLRFREPRILEQLYAVTQQFHEADTRVLCDCEEIAMLREQLQQSLDRLLVTVLPAVSDEARGSFDDPEELELEDDGGNLEPPSPPPQARFSPDEGRNYFDFSAATVASCRSDEDRRH